MAAPTQIQSDTSEADDAAQDAAGDPASAATAVAVSATPSRAALKGAASPQWRAADPTSAAPAPAPVSAPAPAAPAPADEGDAGGGDIDIEEDPYPHTLNVDDFTTWSPDTWHLPPFDKISFSQ